MNDITRSEPLLAVGTYTLKLPHVDGKGHGIHLLAFDAATGRLREAAVVRGPVNPSYLAVSADRTRLYAVREIDAADGPGCLSFALDRANATLEALDDLATPGGWPCHVSVDARTSQLLLSNYATGEVLAYTLDGRGVPAGEPVVLQRSGNGPNAARQEGTHSHCAFVTPDGRHLWLADLGTDRVVCHPLHDGKPAAEPDRVLPAAPGAGPRHLAFTPRGGLLVNYELNSSVRLYALDGDATAPLAEVSTLPAGWQGENGAGGMRLHPSGRFVYVGNRGHDTIFGARVDDAAGTLTPIGTWPLGGRTPRDLAISPDGRYLLAASQDDAFIRVYTIDPDSGELAFTGYDHPIASAVCLEFI